MRQVKLEFELVPDTQVKTGCDVGDARPFSYSHRLLNPTLAFAFPGDEVSCRAPLTFCPSKLRRLAVLSTNAFWTQGLVFDCEVPREPRWLASRLLSSECRRSR